MLHQANWRIHDDYEYVIVGDGITIYEDRLAALISSTIRTDEFYYSSDRHSGGLISINEAAAKITEAFANGAQDIVLADTSLHHLIQVQSQGVARSGSVGG